MSSTSESNGALAVTLTFENGTDPDIAQVQVQNKLQGAIPLLPQVVQQQGISVTKADPSFLHRRRLRLRGRADDAQRHRRLRGAAPWWSRCRACRASASVQLFGAQYAMRIWLDPSKLNTYKLTPGDVVAAIRAQNAQVSARPARRRAGGARPAAQRHDHRAGAPADAGAVPRHRRCAATPAARCCGWATWRASSSARPTTASSPATTASRHPGVAIKLATGANALDAARGVEQMIARARALLPARPEGGHPLRHHALRARLDRARW